MNVTDEERRKTADKIAEAVMPEAFLRDDSVVIEDDGHFNMFRTAQLREADPMYDSTFAGPSLYAVWVTRKKEDGNDGT